MSEIVLLRGRIMPNVFNLAKIAQTVKSQRPARILVVDTNVLMNEPDPQNWSVTPAGSTLFVLPDSIFHELEFIRQKRESRDKTESQRKADTAIKSLARLFRQGTITEGIPIKAGWVIGVPSPRQDELERELKEVEDIVKAFGRYDTKLLLLTGECSQLFESTPVVLVTGEVNLFNVAETNGVSCHLHTGFPIEGLKEAAAITKPVDWEQVLGEIQSGAKQNAVVVEATLTQRSAPPWLQTGNKPLIIAEEHGVMRDGDKGRPFLWTIPFYPQTLASRSRSLEESNSGLPSMYPIYLDFLGQDEPEQDIFDAIADKLLDCTNLSFDEDRPTLQNPESVMEMLLFFEYIDRKGMSEDTVERLKQEIEESEGLSNYWAAWVLNKEADGKYGDEQFACLESLILALKNCWKIGQTYKFSIMLQKDSLKE